MAKDRLIEELDDAVEAIMAKSDALTQELDPRIAEVLRIAAGLRDLPSPVFKARLISELLSKSQSAPSHGKPLRTSADIEARLKEMAKGPAMIAHDVKAALADLPEMTMRFLASMNRHTIGVTRSSADSHWERHPVGDELLHILEGEVEVVTLTGDGPVHSIASAGSVFICPKGLWHRLLRRKPASILFATPGEGTELSSAEDPRRDGKAHGPAKRVRRSSGRRDVIAHDLSAALAGVPELNITSETTGEEAQASFRQLTSFDECAVGVMRFSGLTPWERHPGGDELLHVLEGEVDVTLLTDGGPVHRTVSEGSVFVCPRGLWHRQLPRPKVSMLFATPTKTTEVSFAEDPRLG